MVNFFGNLSKPNYFIIEPSLCARIKCEFYSECQVSQDKPTCVCPANCDNEPKKRLCGNDGQTYESECHMRIASCKKKELITRAYDGECGKLDFQ